MSTFSPLQKYTYHFFSYVLIIFSCTLFLSRIICAQTQNIQFKHLSNDDGLSHNWVRSVYQDKYGFIWIGTDDGLNRFDGITFRQYKNNAKDKHSLGGHAVPALFEDSKNRLWVGTDQGLNLYDRQHDCFIHNPQWPHYMITALAEDSDHRLWIGTTTNLFYLDLQNDSVHTYGQKDFTLSKGSLSNGNILSILAENNNSIWIGTSQGLNLYDPETGTMINYYHDDKDPNSLSNDGIHSFVKDHVGRIWIGTAEGLELFLNAKDHPQQGRFIHYHNKGKDPYSIMKDRVLSLMEDKKHRLWVGIENGGLNMVDLNTFTIGHSIFAHFQNNPNDETSISNNSIHCLFQDKQGNILIGTFGKGINIISTTQSNFPIVKHERDNSRSINNEQVNTFLEDKNFLWIGTEGGLERYSKKDGTVKHFVHDPLRKTSLCSNAVWALCKDKDGNFWIGTWAGGLDRFNERTETFEHHTYNPKDSNSLSNNNIFALCEDRNKNLWIGTMGGGLDMLDPQRKQFTRYKTKTSELQSKNGLLTDYVEAIIESKNGDLWLVNTTGIICINAATKQFKQFIHNENDSTSISGDRTISLYRDSKDHLWFGTEAGLNYFDFSSKTFRSYQVSDGLPDNTITGILEDNHGNLWLSTNKGLSKFIDAVHLPIKPTFKNYTREDGLQSNIFTQRSVLKGADGKLYFGGINGFNVFDPDKIEDNSYVPPVVITDFKIFNQPVPVGKEGSPLKTNVNITDEIVLSHKQSVFSFDFAALNYLSPSKNQYAYKMEGFDHDWNYIGNKHTATYTNLDPGEYIFRVIGSNNDGVWNMQGTSIRIIITPPYWQTMWFRFLVIGLLSVIIYWVYRRSVQVQKIAEQHRIDQVIATERNLLRTLIDHIPDLIYVKDTTGLKTISNQADALFENSYSKTNPSNTIDHIEKLTIVPSFNEQSILQAGKPMVNIEESIVDEQGQIHWFLTSKIPLRDEKGQIIGLVSIARDITQRKKAETEREQSLIELQEALADIKKLSGLVPICSSCKKIRDDKGYWNQVEAYIQDHSEARFTHGLCPDCMKKLYPEYAAQKGKN